MLMVAFAAAGVLLCMTSLRRYNFLLVRAECLGEQSVCAQCRVYGVLHVLSEGAGDQVDAQRDNAWIRVRCKKCGYEWRMDNAGS